MPKCKTCKVKFEAVRPLQQVCSYKCAIEHKKAQDKKKWQKEKKQIKENLKTLSDHIKELQIIFNKYIRLRDKNKNCISCDKSNGGNEQAGHYRSVGSCPELRFNEFNVNGQCVRCNMYLHGNLINYRNGLIKKYGIEKVLELEKQHNPKKYNKNDILRLKEIYKIKTRSLDK